MTTPRPTAVAVRRREPLRITLTRTLGIALVAGVVVALSTGRLRRWPEFSLLMLWPSVGGHWVDVLFLNGIRPHLPESRLTQRLIRLALWFGAGIVLALGVQLTVGMLFAQSRLVWLTWAIAGFGFVAIELVAHAALHLRGRSSFYNGLG